MNGQPRPTGQPPQGKRPGEQNGARGLQRWAVLFIVAALIGGLAATALTRESVLWAVLLSLLVAAVALVALALGLLDDDAETSRRAPSRRRRPPRHAEDHTAPARSDLTPPLPRPGPPGSAGATRAGEPGGAARDAGPVVPTRTRPPQPPEQASENRPWWERPAAAPAAPPAAAPAADDQVPRHAELAATAFAEFGDQAQIAQCPWCGSFRVDAGTQPVPPWHFACHECGRGWTWGPGDPWPAVEVRPNARRPAEKPGW